MHSCAALQRVVAQQAARAGAIACRDGLHHRLVFGIGHRKPAAVLQPAKPEQQQAFRHSGSFRSVARSREVDEQIVEFQIERV